MTGAVRDLRPEAGLAAALRDLIVRPQAVGLLEGAPRVIWRLRHDDRPTVVVLNPGDRSVELAPDAREGVELELLGWTAHEFFNEVASGRLALGLARGEVALSGDLRAILRCLPLVFAVSSLYCVEVGSSVAGRVPLVLAPADAVELPDRPVSNTLTDQLVVVSALLAALPLAQREDELRVLHDEWTAGTVGDEAMSRLVSGLLELVDTRAERQASASGTTV